MGRGGRKIKFVTVTLQLIQKWILQWQWPLVLENYWILDNLHWLLFILFFVCACCHSVYLIKQLYCIHLYQKLVVFSTKKSFTEVLTLAPSGGFSWILSLHVVSTIIFLWPYLRFSSKIFNMMKMLCKWAMTLEIIFFFITHCHDLWLKAKKKVN